MWQKEKQSLASPFDCAVCGACVYGKNSGVRTCLPCKSFFRRHAFLPANTLQCNENGTCNIEATRRYFSASSPPCRACRLQKCLTVGMDQALLRPRSVSSPPLKTSNPFFSNTLLKTSSLDDNSVSSTKQIPIVRRASDASDYQRRFVAALREDLF